MLCLDEPTAGVAQRETEAFGPLMLRIREELDASLLVIEHDMPLIMSISDRVYCLEAGRVICEGTPAEVRNDPAVVASYLGTDERAIQRSGSAPVGPPLNLQACSRQRCYIFVSVTSHNFASGGCRDPRGDS